MGLFSRPKPAEEAPLTPPISQERLIDLFKERGWHYFVDSDGDLGGTWDDDQFYFMLRGENREILHIQSLWHLSVPMEKLEEARAFIREWHRTKLWPKAYHRINDEGVVRIFCENSIDWEHGATDAQINQQVSCALGTASEFYRELGAALGM